MRPDAGEVMPQKSTYFYPKLATGLVIGPDEPRPDLTIVVVNDDGGSIFAMLEQGDPAYADRYDRLFGTPHHVDLASLCAATRTPHWKVSSRPELEQAVAEGWFGAVSPRVVDRIGDIVAVARGTLAMVRRVPGASMAMRGRHQHGIIVLAPPALHIRSGDHTILKHLHVFLSKVREARPILIDIC